LGRRLQAEQLGRRLLWIGQLPWTVKEEEEQEEEKGLAVGEESCGWKLCGAHMIKLLLLPLLFPWIAVEV
jgi:hypothetical protein